MSVPRPRRCSCPPAGCFHLPLLTKTRPTPLRCSRRPPPTRTRSLLPAWAYELTFELQNVEPGDRASPQNRDVNSRSRSTRPDHARVPVPSLALLFRAATRLFCHSSRPEAKKTAVALVSFQSPPRA